MKIALPRQFSVKLVIKTFFYFAVIVTMALSWWLAYEFYAISTEDMTSNDTANSGNTSSYDSAVCNVQGIELHGTLVTYIPPSAMDTDGFPLEDQTASQSVTSLIATAEKNPSIKAIFLEVDSYGGGPVAGEEIEQALKNAKKPTVAMIREGGASAAYLAATGADVIFASKASDVGGIGVTYSYLDKSRQNQQQGLTYNQVSVGQFKDMGDPDKSLTADERAIMLRTANIVHQNFIRSVAENRNMDIENVKSLADGATVLGEAALADGLIDRIGGLPEVKEYLKTIVGDDVKICW